MVKLRLTIFGDDQLALGHADLVLAKGREKCTAAPPRGLSSAQISPPCASMMDFEIARPMPIPEGFVV
jgi:hypothetical protein